MRRSLLVHKIVIDNFGPVDVEKLTQKQCREIYDLFYGIKDLEDGECVFIAFHRELLKKARIEVKRIENILAEYKASA